MVLEDYSNAGLRFDAPNLYRTRILGPTLRPEMREPQLRDELDLTDGEHPDGLAGQVGWQRKTFHHWTLLRLNGFDGHQFPPHKGHRPAIGFEYQASATSSSVRR